MTSRRIFTWSPAAIVFDCDGTLVDTERHWQDARIRVFGEFGLKSRPGFAERAKGLHYTECGSLMAREAGKPQLADDMTQALLRNFMALVAEDPVTMPGAAALVRLAAGNLPLAVASNCPLDVVETSLARVGLLNYFAHVVVAGDGLLPKPHPDVYTTAVRLCSVRPEEAMAVEDSVTGVESARRAGMRVLGVGPRPSGEGADRADLWLRTLADPELQAWAHTWAEGTA
ncbi:HAD family phosphatase [Streptomyces sp. NBC_00893]|uniref:HAD family hydrolase n=1 Tax=Streptomyces sp. NBC_00893 TaxID=2975862 RepID=UPI0022583E7D|nr:HAD family phosphatase [Streptomyces sp. NBC_00893]MCX4851032.1 HAD family phosphatase [Streptomyces sp. NBC_00893]